MDGYKQLLDPFSIPPSDRCPGLRHMSQGEKKRGGEKKRKKRQWTVPDPTFLVSLSLSLSAQF